MPRYMFHTQTTTRHTDNEGVELPGAIQARHEAIRLCGEMMKDAPVEFWGSRPWNVTVTDQTGVILWQLFVDGVSSPASAGLG